MIYFLQFCKFAILQFCNFVIFHFCNFAIFYFLFVYQKKNKHITMTSFPPCFQTSPNTWDANYVGQCGAMFSAEYALDHALGGPQRPQIHVHDGNTAAKRALVHGGVLRRLRARPPAAARPHRTAALRVGLDASAACGADAATGFRWLLGARDRRGF